MSDSEKKSGGSQEKKPSQKKDNFFVRRGKGIAKWFREMRSELKKVVWPTRKQVINNTWVVILSVIVVGVFISLFDLGTSLLVKFLISLGH